MWAGGPEQLGGDPPPRPWRLQRDGPALPAQMLTQGSVVLGNEETLLM